MEKKEIYLKNKRSKRKSLQLTWYYYCGTATNSLSLQITQIYIYM